MAQQTINVGSAANDGTGDPVRTAFTKANANFGELYARPVGSGTVNSGTAGTLAFYALSGTALSSLTLGTNLSITGTTLNAAGGGGGSTSPGGTNGQIQINSSGSFGGITLLPVANGGTGTASPGIVAGTNVTVTGTWPNQTVAASGGSAAAGGTNGQLQVNSGGALAGLTLGTNLSVSGSTLNAAGGSSSAFPVTTVAASSTAQTLAFPASGLSTYDVTLTGNCALTFNSASIAAGQRSAVELWVRGGSSSFTPSYPAGVKWVGGVAPSGPIAAGALFLATFRTSDAGTTIVGEF